ncbi:hypothetical protein D0Z07_8365 [Hyphodiscus hymeniophilus]|uniref:CENP-V/GFA domain-containing protein n=1 Tax=Hyphodiscus hymeniophilus TaxID=353542 RepID=A0A9P6VEC9_9HELO|nr:hypothetical protein D0Z07_8365 [Hyphodiscus hymeniophilus]
MSTTSEPALTGGCQCGAVTYESTALPDELTNCHCFTCRKISGGAYLTFARFPSASLTWKSKSNALKTTQYSDMAMRWHCADCGSPISMMYKFQREKISLTAGSIDEKSVKGVLVKPVEHIFLAEKAPWFIVPDDGLNRFETFPDMEGFVKKMEEWKKGSKTGGAGGGREFGC